MITIWKAPLRLYAQHGKTWRIEIPARVGAKVISAALQKVEPMIWFEIDTDKLDANLIVYAIGTGCGEIPKGARFINTFIDGDRVWHIYAE